MTKFDLRRCAIHMCANNDELQDILEDIHARIVKLSMRTRYYMLVINSYC